jgi:hypothetical protein
MGGQKLRCMMLAAAAFAASVWIQTPAHAAVIFSDNFDTDSAVTVLNFNAFNNWTVVNHPTETVDYIRSGGFGISCFGGTGGCVDLDGSTGNAGRMVSNTIFDFEAGVVYTLSAQVSGNQRGGADDAFEMGVEGLASVALSPIAPSDPFTTRTLSFVSALPFSGRLFIQDGNPGGDNIGPILDNVVLSDNRTVPEPGTLALLALGLAVLAIRRREH